LKVFLFFIPLKLGLSNKAFLLCMLSLYHPNIIFALKEKIFLSKKKAHRKTDTPFTYLFLGIIPIPGLVASWRLLNEF